MDATPPQYHTHPLYHTPPLFHTPLYHTPLIPHRPHHIPHLYHTTPIPYPLYPTPPQNHIPIYTALPFIPRSHLYHTPSIPHPLVSVDIMADACINITFTNTTTTDGGSIDFMFLGPSPIRSLEVFTKLCAIQECQYWQFRFGYAIGKEVDQ